MENQQNHASNLQQQSKNSNANMKKKPQKNKTILWVVIAVLVAVIGVCVWLIIAKTSAPTQNTTEENLVTEEESAFADIEGNPLFRYGLIPVEQDGKYGYMNAQGELVVPYQYDYALPMNNGVGRVMMNRKIHYITSDGTELVPLCLYDSVVGDFSEGFVGIRYNEKYGFINRNGVLVISMQYDDIHDFKEGMAAVSVDGKWGFINKQGDMIAEPKYDEVHDFKEGMAAVCIDEKWGFINQQGEEIVPVTCNNVLDFSEGFAILYRSDGTGFVNPKGELTAFGEYDFVSPFSEGMAAVGYVFGEYPFEYQIGFINQKGEEVVPPVYDAVEPFSEGLAVVSLDGKYGFINQKGEVVIPLIYRSASGFSGGAAVVNLDGISGYINPQGEFSTFSQDDEGDILTAGRFVDGVSVIYRSGDAGVVNARGEEIIPIEYFTISFYDDCILARANGVEYQVYDYEGNLLLDCVRLGIDTLPISNEVSFNQEQMLIGRVTH